MKFFRIKPEQAGTRGPGTILDRNSPNQNVATAVDFCFQLYPTDDIVYCPWAISMVTDRLAEALKSSALTGYALHDSTCSIDPEYSRHWRNDPKDLPHFTWLKMGGEAFKDDFGTPDDTKMIISERALELLKKFSITKMEITEAESPR